MGFRRPILGSGQLPGGLGPAYTGGIVSDGLFPENFPNYRRKFANTIAGTGNTKVLVLGDSQAWGTVTAPPTNPPGPAGCSWPSRMTTLLNTYYFSSVIGLSIPMCYAANVPNSDTRWVTTGWFSGTNFGYGFGGNSSWIAAPGVADMLYTPGIASADTFDIYYVATGGLGTFKMALDAAASGGTSVNTGNTGIGIQKATIAGAATGAHVLHIGAVTVSNVVIVAIDAYLSTGASLRIGNAGIPACAAIQFADLAAPVGGVTSSIVGSITTILAYAPDLTMIHLGGVIDGVSFPRQFTQYQAAIQTIVRACQTSGDVILMSEPPVLSDVTTVTSLDMEAQAAPWLQNFAAQNNLGYVDHYSRFSPSAKYNALGYYNAADFFHPSVQGYADLGYSAFKALTSIA